MDMSQAFGSLNWLAIFAAAISAFLLGGAWYSKGLFGKAWMKACGFTEADLQQGNIGKVFGVSFLLALFAAFNLAMFIGPQADAAYGATAGFLAGLGWVSTMIGIHYLFERKSLAHFLINAGYSTVALTIMGVILGAWH